MSNGFQTIGWILTARDMATKPLRKATEFMQRQSNETGAAFARMSDRIAGDMKAGGALDKAAGFFKRTFIHVFGSAVTEPMQATTDAAVAMTESVTGALDKIAAKTSDVVNSIFFKERSFSELFKAGAKGAVIFGKTTVGVFKKTITMGRTLVTTVGGVFSKLSGVGDVLKGFKKMGGIGGVLLGPLGPLLDLFSPLIQMFTKQFTPAIETFSAIVETAFGPFAETLEVIARSIALKLVPIIRPLGAFLELAAVMIGNLIGDLLKGKPDVMFAAVFKAFKDSGPIISRLLTLLLDMSKEVGGELLTAFVKLAPMIVKTFTGFLKAILPLIPPMTKLAVTLLEKVFLPMMVQLVKILDKHIIPFIEKHAPAMGKVIDQIAKRVADFYGNLGKYATDFKILMVDPVVKWFDDLWAKIKPFAARIKKDVIDPIVRNMKPVIDKVEKLVKAFNDITGRSDEKLKAATQAAGATRARLNAEQNTADLAKRAGLVGLSGNARRLKLDAYMREQDAKKRKGLALGGITTGPIDATIGEGKHQEMVLPLEKQTIERVLAPLLPELKMPPVQVKLPPIEIPGLEQLVDFAQELLSMASRRGIKVDTGLTMPTPETVAATPRPDRGDNLSMSIGFTGGGGF